MTARVIDGRALARELRDGLAMRVLALRDRGVTPHLRVVMIGEDESSAAYVRGMNALGTKIGVDVGVDRLPTSTDDAGVRAALLRYGTDPAIHGVILQQPLPRGLSIRSIASAMPEHKDVDGASPQNQGRLAFASGTRFVPATPAAVMLLLERSQLWPLRGSNVTVVGRSSVVGLPVALLLIAQSATVTVAHSATRDIVELARRADVLVVATGRPGLVDGDWIRPGATVIDVGTTVVGGTLRGDVDFASAGAVAGEITPVPGGVGPVTNVALMRNVVSAAESALSISSG